MVEKLLLDSVARYGYNLVCHEVHVGFRTVTHDARSIKDTNLLIYGSDEFFLVDGRNCREVPATVGLYGNFRGGERLRNAIARMMQRTFMGVEVNMFIQLVWKETYLLFISYGVLAFHVQQLKSWFMVLQWMDHQLVNVDDTISHCIVQVNPSHICISSGVTA